MGPVQRCCSPMVEISQGCLRCVGMMRPPRQFTSGNPLLQEDIEKLKGELQKKDGAIANLRAKVGQVTWRFHAAIASSRARVHVRAQWQVQREKDTLEREKSSLRQTLTQQENSRASQRSAFQPIVHTAELKHQNLNDETASAALGLPGSLSSDAAEVKRLREHLEFAVRSVRFEMMRAPESCCRISSISGFGLSA